MAQILPLELRTISVGEAATFRGDLNYNFDQIKAYFDDFRSGPDIVVSKTMPTNQQSGDFWLKILD